MKKRKTAAELQVEADMRTLKWLKDAKPETRKYFFMSLEGGRDGLEPVAIYDHILSGGFSHMQYVGCQGCKDWMSSHSPTRGTWAVKHRNCSGFRFFLAMENIPDDYTTEISPLEMLAGIADEWEEET